MIHPNDYDRLPDPQIYVYSWYTIRDNDSSNQDKRRVRNYRRVLKHCLGQSDVTQFPYFTWDLTHNTFLGIQLDRDCT